jgi:hypothetical protein
MEHGRPLSERADSVVPFFSVVMVMFRDGCEREIGEHGVMDGWDLEKREFAHQGKDSFCIKRRVQGTLYHSC